MGQVTIKKIGNNKLKVIQIVRQFTGIGLKEAKEFVEIVDSGTFAAISSVPEDEIDNVLYAFTSAGAVADKKCEHDFIERIICYHVTNDGVAQSIDDSHMKEKLSPARYQAKPSPVIHKKSASLKDYLRTIASLECQLLTQNRAISILTRRANSLGNKKEISKPCEPSFFADGLMDLSEDVSKLCVGCFLVGTGWMIAIGVLWQNYLLAFLGFGIGVILSLLPGFCKYLSYTGYYRKELKRYHEDLAADESRVKRELPVRNEIHLQVKSIKAECEQTKKALRGLYDLGIIHPDYRNIVAVCSLYDYFDKGICTKLTGRDGAYAFYEEALRFKRIETRLDVIIEKLDEIIVNQQQIASLIQQGNNALYRIERQNSSMLSSLAQIQENTALTEYNTRCASESLSALENIEVYRLLRYD